jgi:hypothetical protein
MKKGSRLAKKINRLDLNVRDESKDSIFSFNMREIPL